MSAVALPDLVRLLLAWRGSRTVEALKNLILGLMLWKTTRTVAHSLIFRGVRGTVKHFVWLFARHLLKTVRALPTPASGAIQAEIGKTLASLEKQIRTPVQPGDPQPYMRLPEDGLERHALHKELVRYQNIGHIDYKEGKVSGAVYHGGHELYKVIAEAFGMFCSSNPLHPDVFPGVRKMEAEVIAMCLDLFHADPQHGCGNMTSGGTESILMACKTYRDYAAAVRGVTEPEMIVPSTVHAAFDKAAHYFKIKLVQIPVDPKTYQMDLKLAAKAVTKNTVMLAGSTPNFPHGIMDDIEGLAAIARKHKIPLHVDCCLGSFLMPFMKDAGFTIPPFDFSVEGVTSMSVDTHKYGFAPKGSSIIMYSSGNIRKYQYSLMPEWSGGIYASPTIAGSRPGALIAGCWATLMFMGKKGYIDACNRIVGAQRTIRDGIREIPELQVVGEPKVSVVAFTAKGSLNVYGINDVMSAKGWNLNALQYPSAIHIACTMLTADHAQEFVNDLKDAVAQVKQDPKKFEKGSAAIYGMAASIPDKGIVEDIITGYLDICSKP
ncbi:Dihydrosphingosine phosphate lyase [Sorochytrium milnesiophthora]